ncbi:MAG: SIS domain-containing protein [Rubrivivax sp.]
MPNSAPALAPVSTERALQLAGAALDIETRAVAGLKARLGPSFAAAVNLVLACRGRVVVTGMGKSGHVGRKIAATLASTGTPALFMHPAEASHGDLGMVTPADVVLAISNSGESDELNVILPVLKRQGIALLAMTGRAGSSLARHADVVLDSGVDEEACPLNLAPTASTTAQIALGDALAVTLLEVRGFGQEDFARSHPGGALGRRLLVHVHDVMRAEPPLPAVLAEASFTALLQAISVGGMGIAAVVDEAQRVVGVFTDGDLRRTIEQGGDLRALTAGAVMHRHPRSIQAGALAAEAAALMEQHKINSLLVTDPEGRLVGTLNTNALMRAKVI